MVHVLEEATAFVTNAEVASLLREKAAHLRGSFSPASLSEAEVLVYLSPQNERVLSPTNLQAFIQAVEDKKLSRTELLQLINLKPKALVEIHLIVDRCEERLTAEQQEQLLRSVHEHLL